ncbi:hypothetical protein [Micromonospora profundi]|uniref:hypothetical protein n=1 Tax=Micromonospora profundi TaxID=1420889 RepID=UPI0036521D1D
MTDLIEAGNCPHCTDGVSPNGWECSTCGGTGTPAYCGDCGHLPDDCTCDDDEDD